MRKLCLREDYGWTIPQQLILNSWNHEFSIYYNEVLLTCVYDRSSLLEWARKTTRTFRVKQGIKGQEWAKEWQERQKHQKTSEMETRIKKDGNITHAQI